MRRVLRELRIHQSRRYAEPREYFHTEVPKVCVSSEDGTDDHENDRVHRRHDEERTNSIGQQPLVQNNTGWQGPVTHLHLAHWEHSKYCLPSDVSYLDCVTVRCRPLARNR